MLRVKWIIIWPWPSCMLLGTWGPGCQSSATLNQKEVCCSACSPPLMESTACREWARLKDHIVAFLFWSFKTLLITHNLSLNFFAFFSSCKVLFLLKARLFYQGNDNPYSWVSKHSNIYTLDLVPRIKHIFHFQIQLAIPRLFLYL